MMGPKNPPKEENYLHNTIVDVEPVCCSVKYFLAIMVPAKILEFYLPQECFDLRDNLTCDNDLL